MGLCTIFSESRSLKASGIPLRVHAVLHVSGVSTTKQFLYTLCVSTCKLRALQILFDGPDEPRKANPEAKP